MNASNPPSVPGASQGDETPPVMLKRQTHAEQIAQRCVHFTGVGNTTCAASVCYRDVGRDHDLIRYRRPGGAVYTKGYSLPCLAQYNLGGATCDKARFPTAEEVAAEVAESDRSVARMLAARKVIVAHIEATGEQHALIPCPNCDGQLSYSRAASNGHIWANCSTENCTAWME